MFVTACQGTHGVQQCARDNSYWLEVKKLLSDVSCGLVRKLSS